MLKKDSLRIFLLKYGVMNQLILKQKGTEACSEKANENHLIKMGSEW
jgi:hypothetical protein